MAHLQSFPRHPSYGVGSASSSAAPSVGTSVPSTSNSAPIAGPSTFVPTQYPTAVPAVPALSAIPNANPYAAYAPMFPATSIPAVA